MHHIYRMTNDLKIVKHLFFSLKKFLQLNSDTFHDCLPKSFYV